MDTTNKILLPAAVILAGLFIGGAVIWNGSHPSTTSRAHPGGFGDAASIDKLNATIPGLDAGKIAADVRANQSTYKTQIEADKAIGVKVGVQSTPTTLIGNRLVLGAQPYAVIKQVLDNPNIPPDGPSVPDDHKRIFASQVAVKDIDISNEPFIGNADAPETMIFFSDFQCPYCKEFETGGQPQLDAQGMLPAMPDIIKDYVQTGKVKIVFIDFAFLGPDSTTAALYNRSVWKLYPDKYFEWRTAMFKAQDEENNSGSVQPLD